MRYPQLSFSILKSECWRATWDNSKFFRK